MQIGMSPVSLKMMEYILAHLTLMARAIVAASAVATKEVRIATAATSFPLLVATTVYVRDPLQVVPAEQAPM